MKKTLTVVLVLALLASTLAAAQFAGFASANPAGSFPVLSMPVEYVNYTITSNNGTLWAKIDGNYPIYLLNQSDCAFDGELPMVYPMPPGTTNIHVTLDDHELAWSNYTAAYPDALHHTAIGDWWMIYSVLDNVSGFFVLKIHYEHPLEVVNGSYLFLYDLNISPYLSPQSTNSTCYYTIRMETNTTNLHAYTSPPDSSPSEWKPINVATTGEGSTEVASITMHSEYGVPLVGDLVVEFSAENQVPEFPLPTILALVAIISIATLICIKTKKSFLS